MKGSKTLIKYITKQDLIDILHSSEPLAGEQLRTVAWKAVEEYDIPTTKMEDWRKTNLKRLLEHKFQPGQKLELHKEQVSMFNISGMYSNVLVFVNGYFCPKLSRILDSDKILVFTNMRTAKEYFPDVFERYFDATDAHKLNLFSALNTYYARDGAFIWIRKDTVVENPIHVYYFSEGNNAKIASQTRNLLIAEPGSKANVLFSYHPLSNDFTFHNVVTEIFVRENANLEYNLFQGEGDNSFQINYTQVHVDQGAKFYANTITMCGQIVRNDMRVRMLGADSYAELNGLAMPDREQLHDNTVFVHHLTGYSTSRQIYRNIVDNHARAVWYGKVKIDKLTPHCEAHQDNRNILLSDKAQVHARPHLIIYNDDVIASHGSATGQMDQEAIFYMRSRGIGEKQAKTMLLEAFANEILDKIRIKAYMYYVKTLVRKRLAGERVELLCAHLGECRGQSA